MRHLTIGPCTPEEKQEVMQHLIEQGEPVEIFGVWYHPELNIIFFSNSSRRWMSSTDRETNISAQDFLQSNGKV
jgi:hypothetical protein